MIFLYFMLIVNIYIHSIGTLLSKRLNYNTLVFYAELHAINQCGMDIIRMVSGLLMAVGFWAVVFSNWVLKDGWKFLPMSVYFLVAVVLSEAYFVMIETLPLAIQCNKDSKYMIAKWKRLVIKHYDTFWKNQFWHRIGLWLFSTV